MRNPLTAIFGDPDWDNEEVKIWKATHQLARQNGKFAFTLAHRYRKRVCRYRNAFPWHRKRFWCFLGCILGVGLVIGKWVL